MVPIVSFGAAGHLIRRYGPAVVIILGSLSFAAGQVWWALGVTVTPDYVSGVLGGQILVGIGVGLTLPTMMGAATASLPPHAFATGSAVLNMIRQTGLALGVAVLVAVLGTGAAHRSPELITFQHAWWLTAGLSLAGIVPTVAWLRRPRPAVALATVTDAAETPRAAARADTTCAFEPALVIVDSDG